MPTYTFENIAGERIEANKPMGTQEFVNEGVTWKRITEPEGFRMHTGASLPDQREQMRRGYYRAEHRGWNSRFSKTKIKKVWDL
jgi:hypothetical protein